ncbi:MAG TPA: histidine kinase dimerization/phospho-acceptor domain-containing protein [Blastocatellia bacterium]|nr:histidine kinase dimerization/phospho-acceptor domain-containing protein [Blastocatellia bacterium]
MTNTKPNLTSEEKPPESNLVSRWRHILDKVSDGVSVHSSTSRILWANKRLCDMYGKTLSELVGLTCQEVFHHGADCNHEEVVRSGRGTEFETQVSGRAVSVRIEPLLKENDPGFGFARIVCVGPDRELEEQLKQAERLASLGQLLFGMAHSVGTPLNIISGYTEFLLMRMGSGEGGSKELSAILDQTRRIAILFSEALEMARAPQGRIDPIELTRVLEDSLDLATHHFRKADVKAELTCTMSPPLIYGEATRLKQAFFNLLLNAAQLVGTGGRLELVVGESVDSPGWLTLEVWGTEGTGCGHDFSRSLRCLLDADWRSETGRRLGLSLVKEVFDDAGAQMGFGREGKRGVPFVIHLPLRGAVKPTRL